MSLILAAVLAICFGTSYGACPPGFKPHGASCYHFSDDTESFTGALDVCQLFGAYLVEIETQAEDDWIRGQCQNYQESFWIGLTDLLVKDTYIWMNSKRQLAPGDYTNWEDGQPDHRNGDEECVNLEDSFGYRWNDMACHINQQYICEMKNRELEIIG